MNASRAARPGSLRSVTFTYDRVIPNVIRICIFDALYAL